MRLLCFFLLFNTLYADLTALYLSWYADPATTMAIQWHTPADEYGDTIYLQTAEGKWQLFQGEHALLEDTLIHKVFLKDLSANTEYTFRVGEERSLYRFRTAPTHLDEPIRFVIGGDLYASKKLFRRMCQTAIETDPLFAVLGGDIAYARSLHPFKQKGLRRWLSFLYDWKELMKTEDGRLIPFLLVPGNHDIAPDDYELFFTLFAFPQKQLYRTLDFGDYLTLFLLDTGHFQPIEGRQTLWLKKALANQSHTPYRFAIYHEAAYPSYYSYSSSTPQKIRDHWVPLFEQFHIQAAFENHNHTFKKTHPLLHNQIDPSGIIYFGDGSWGARPRPPKDLWYLEKRARKNAIYLIELTEEKGTIQALDLIGAPLDSTNIRPNN